MTSLTLLVIFESTSLQHRQAARPRMPNAIDTIATTLEETIRNNSFLLFPAKSAGKRYVSMCAYNIALQ